MEILRRPSFGGGGGDCDDEGLYDRMVTIWLMICFSVPALGGEEC
jgi:hypothetical protein